MSYQHTPPAQATVRWPAVVTPPATGSQSLISSTVSFSWGIEPEPVLPAPSLVAGPITGYRLWPIYVDGPDVWLGSIYMSGTVWLPGIPLEARCIDGDFLASHAPPGARCNCGIYAMRHAEQLLYYRDADPYAAQRGRLIGVACGALMLWGRVIEHQHGYRAQYAYPRAIWPYRPTGALPKGFPKPQGWVEPMLRIGEAYGIAVLPAAPEPNA